MNFLTVSQQPSQPSVRPSFRLRLFLFFLSLLLLTPTFVVHAKTYSNPFPISQNVSAAIISSNNNQLLQVQGDERTFSPLRMICFLIALTAKENADLSTVIKVPDDVLNAVADDLDVIYLWPGEELTVRQLIGAVLYNVSNDAAYTLAVTIGGSVENFLQMMNETARKHRATHSNFTSIYTEEAPGQYTTASDMAYICSALWEGESMINLLNGDIFTIPPTNKTNEARYYANPCIMRLLGNENYYSYAAFSRSCDECMVLYSTSDDMSLVSVVFGELDEYRAFTDARKLMIYGHEYYQRVRIHFPGNSISRLPVYRQTERIGYADVVLTGDLEYYAEIFSRKPTDPEALTNFFSHDIDLPSYLNDPIAMGSKVGQVTYSMLEDPQVQVRMDLTIGDLTISQGSDTDTKISITRDLGTYINLFCLVLIAVILILLYQLLFPIIQRWIRKPKNY